MVMLALMVLSLSATKSEPATLILKVLPAVTVPVDSTPLTVILTVSPTCASPPTVPVIATVPAASALLITSPEVMLASKVIVGTGALVSIVISKALDALNVLWLPALSVIPA